MNNAEVLIKFKGDTKDVDTKTKKVNVSMGSIAKGVLAATGITKALSAAWNMVSNSLDGAISRLDAMNNFPKVMSNLGIGAEESQKAIDTLSDKLTGLPTSLDSAAMSVQRLTSKNGDIKKSTDLFLAMNNAILAGGASSEIQSSAIEQLSQAYAKGKPDMMEWRTLMTAMPAQLKQVATAMGYVSADALGESLRDGSVSMDQFMEKIVEMNQTGVNGFKSFDEQARNATGGIATSITNMRTAVTRGVANVVNSLDKGLKNAGMGGLSQVISNIGKTMENVLKQVAKGIQTIVPKIISIFQWMKKHETLIKTLAIVVGSFIGTIMLIKKVIAIINAVKTAFALLNVVMAMNPITLIIAGIVALVAAFIYLWKHCEGFRNFFINLFTSIVDFFKNNWKSLLLLLVNPFAGAFKLLYDNCEGFRNFFIGMWEGIKTIVNTAIAFIVNLFTSVVDFFKNNWKSLLLLLVNPFAGAFKLLYDNCEGFRNFVNNFVSTIANFFINLKNKIVNAFNNVVNAIKQLPGKIKAIPGQIISFFASLPSQMASVGLNIVKGIGNGITSGTTWIKNKIRSFVGNVTSFIKKTFKIGSPSKLMAQEVGQWIPKGIAVGITANSDAVNKSMDDIQKQISMSMGMSPQVANSTALNYSPNISVNNQISMKQDPLGQMVSNIKTFSGGAKNDYNYGASI